VHHYHNPLKCFRYLKNFTDESRSSFRSLLKDTDRLQGDDYRKFRWKTVPFVRSGDLLKLEYGLRCFVERYLSYLGYGLATEYVGRYTSHSGSAIVAEPVPIAFAARVRYVEFL
jgi:hypothetical protein